MYREVYQWRVLSEIDSGATVYCLDRKNKQCYAVNDMFVKGLMKVLSEAEADPERFYFWREIENDG